MELTPRIKQILQFVLEKNEPVLEQDIAQHIGVSKRTVQREFDYIAAGLVDYDLSLCKKKNIGVWIDGDAVNLNRLRKEVTEIRIIIFLIKIQEENILYMSFYVKRFLKSYSISATFSE